MHPHFIEHDGRKIFAAYYEPQAAISSDAVLLAYPLGQEYMRSHRAYHQIAKALSLSGVHVLKFDYFGSGDSEGEWQDVCLADCLDDLRYCFTQLREISAARRVSVFASRFACALSQVAFADDQAIDNMIFLDPVLNGDLYLQEQRHLQSAILSDLDRFWTSRNGAQQDNELSGLVYSGGFLDSVAALDEAHKPPARKSRVFYSEANTQSVDAVDRDAARRWGCDEQALQTRYDWGQFTALETMIQPGALLKLLPSLF